MQRFLLKVLFCNSLDAWVDVDCYDVFDPSSVCHLLRIGEARRADDEELFACGSTAEQVSLIAHLFGGADVSEPARSAYGIDRTCVAAIQ